MLKVNPSARIEGLHLAAMNYKGEGLPLHRYSQAELDDMPRPLRFVPSEVAPFIRPFVWKMENFNRKLLKDTDRIFSSDILLAYDWYCSYFRTFEAIRRLGITAEDIGFPPERWEEYLQGKWSCQEDIQTCLNLACEMDTKEEAMFMYKKLVRAFSVKNSLGYLPDYWEAYKPLSEVVGFLQEEEEEAQDPEDEPEEEPRCVTCCFTVPAEVAGWLREKKHMSQFVADLVEKEMNV